jgi:flagellar biogenesis protein FliO
MLTIIFKNFSFDPDRLKEKTVLCAKIILLSLLAIPFAYEYLYSLLYFHYVFIYIGCAICVLRISRTDKKILADPKFIFINIATVFGSLAVLVVLGSTQVLTTIWQVVKFICADIIAPAVMFVINWLNRLFPHTDNNIDITGMDISEGLEAEEYALTDTFTEAGQLPDFVVQIIQWVFIILLILFAIFVLRKITGSFRRKNYAAKGFSEIRSSAVPIPEDIYAGDKQSFFAPRNPRLAVRYHYRRFLKICADKGCPPEKGDTSKDVNLKNKTKFPEEAISRLRELYLKARYSEHAIKATESKEAGELVKHL